jgi:hypothetical protein
MVSDPNHRALVYPIQAITLSTRVAHNLGLSDFNATMVGAAIRMGHCLGIHRIANDVEGTGITTDEAHYLVVEAEVGRRCWLQLLIQDYFQVSFTETYSKSRVEQSNPRHRVRVPANHSRSDSTVTFFHQAAS